MCTLMVWREKQTIPPVLFCKMMRKAQPDIPSQSKGPLQLSHCSDVSGFVSPDSVAVLAAYLEAGYCAGGRAGSKEGGSSGPVIGENQVQPNQNQNDSGKKHLVKGHWIPIVWTNLVIHEPCNPEIWSHFRCWNGNTLAANSGLYSSPDTQLVVPGWHNQAHIHFEKPV